jgi:hypothetical protein
VTPDHPLLLSVVTDPEVQQSSVQILRKRRGTTSAGSRAIAARLPGVWSSGC